MSDLQCPATLLVVRHGQATNARPDASGNDGWLTRRGRGQAAELAAAVHRHAVSTIY